MCGAWGAPNTPCQSEGAVSTQGNTRPPIRRGTIAFFAATVHLSVHPADYRYVTPIFQPVTLKAHLLLWVG